MARGFSLKKGLTKDTLLVLFKLGLIIVASTSPYFLHGVVKQYFKDKSREMILGRARKLRELQRRKLIEFNELSDGTIKIALSHLGKKLIRQYKLEEMKLKQPQRWDGKWRIIIYDIPQSQKKNSDALRRKLRNLGLYQLQKSVWVSPFECVEELEFLCAVFEINMEDYVYYFRAAEIPREREIKSFFNLKT